MGKLKRNQNIAEKFAEYEEFMSSLKCVPDIVKVCNAKPNHPSSTYANEKISGGEAFSSSSLEVEVKNDDMCNFSIQILGENIPGKVLFRFDATTTGAMHRNNVNFIPLSLQQVGHPHYHRYEKNGYLLAYQPEQLKNDASLGEISGGYDYFCRAANIRGISKGSLPSIDVARRTLDLDLPTDPNEGVTFP